MSAAGERNGRAKLTKRQVARIRELLAQEDGPTQREIAARFGVSQTTVSDVRCGKKWKEAAADGGDPGPAETGDVSQEAQKAGGGDGA